MLHFKLKNIDFEDINIYAHVHFGNHRLTLFVHTFLVFEGNLNIDH